MVKINNFQFIQQHLRRHGLPAETPDRVVDAVVRLYQQQCASSTQIAKTVGVSDVAVRRWLRVCGVAIRPRGGCRTQGKPVTLNGETRLWREWFPPEQWSRWERHILYQRLVRSGWPLERALTEPMQPRKVRGKQR